MILIFADIIRRSSDWDLGILADFEQGHKWFFNRNGGYAVAAIKNELAGLAPDARVFNNRR
jgi:hypothetical protein